MDAETLKSYPYLKDGCYLSSTIENNDPVYSRMFDSFDFTVSRIVFSMTVLICIFGLICLFALFCCCCHRQTQSPNSSSSSSSSSSSFHDAELELFTEDVPTEDQGYDGDDDEIDHEPFDVDSVQRHEEDDNDVFYYNTYHSIHPDYNRHCPSPESKTTTNLFFTNTHDQSGIVFCESVELPQG